MEIQELKTNLAEFLSASKMFEKTLKAYIEPMLSDIILKYGRLRPDTGRYNISTYDLSDESIYLRDRCEPEWDNDVEEEVYYYGEFDNITRYDDGSLEVVLDRDAYRFCDMPMDSIIVLVELIADMLEWVEDYKSETQMEKE